MAHDIVKQMRHFDIATTIDLIKQSKKSAKELEGRSVVPFIGRSGAGKTTTILYLTGRPMCVRNNAHRDIAPEPGSEVDGFVINPRPESETAHVKAVPMPPRMLPKGAGGEDRQCNGDTFFADTPGMIVAFVCLCICLFVAHPPLLFSPSHAHTLNLSH